MASMISITSEMLSVESLVYLRALTFEILVEEEYFSEFSSAFDPQKCLICILVKITGNSELIPLISLLPLALLT